MNVFVFSGPDGSGKSTLVKELSKSFDTVPHRHIVSWRRFFHVFSKGVNFLGRLLKQSYYFITPTVRHGYHDYYGILGIIYILTSVFDVLIFARVWWGISDIRHKHYIKIIDRFYLDIVADLIVDTRRTRLVLFLFDPIIRMHLRQCNVYLVYCEPDLVKQRRPDIASDIKYGEKVSTYCLLRRLYGISVINTSKSCPKDLVRIIPV